MDESLIFQYESLDSLPHDTIRLVCILPGKTDQEIECTLTTVSLSSKPNYDALSYMWGPEDDNRWIWLNQKRFQVRQNLWQCLRQLRCNQNTRPLWIDSVCVSQRNFRERTHQVAFMTEIYSNASSVISWLGEDASGISNVLDTTTQSDNLQTFLDEGFACDGPATSICYGCGMVLAIWKAFADICDRQYWTRLWVVQETVLAKTLFLQVGAVQISFQRFLEWSHFAQRRRLKGYGSNDWHCLVDSSDRIHYQRPGFAPQPPYTYDPNFSRSSCVVKLVDGLGYNTNTKRYSLRMLMAICSEQQCSDVRDKVFALLGMCSDFALLRPDYEKTAADLYHDLFLSRQFANEPYAAYLQFDLQLDSKQVRKVLKKRSREDPRFQSHVINANVHKLKISKLNSSPRMPPKSVKLRLA